MDTDRTIDSLTSTDELLCLLEGDFNYGHENTEELRSAIIVLCRRVGELEAIAAMHTNRFRGLEKAGNP